ncbi:hypothetical protein IW261DRAFT_1660708 [Armillaria novae-zelandiae]|uniref:Uncharacterized protein n=1 Tax=Armillaria novae-zelandiae TaxID=153914 RepID=A0AA39NVM8_9AGAR|nr:hypothetical protein IW261DRAFT_1660708 [Armillaria novae-zelandiae]
MCFSWIVHALALISTEGIATATNIIPSVQQAVVSDFISTDSGLMFGTNDSNEEEDDDDENSAMGAVSYFEPTKNLKAQLAEFERDIQEEDGLDDDIDAPIADHFETSDDMDGMEDPMLVSHPDGSSSLPSKQETPPLPNLRVNGDVHHVEQLKSTPGGDEPSPAVKVEMSPKHSLSTWKNCIAQS